METGNNPTPGSAPSLQPGTPRQPVRPIVRRPVVDGFVPRRPQPGVQPGTPASSATPAGAPVLSRRLQPSTHFSTGGTAPAPQRLTSQPLSSRPAQPPTAPLPQQHTQARSQQPVQLHPQAPPQPSQQPPVMAATRPANSDFVATPSATPAPAASVPIQRPSVPDSDTQPPAKSRGPREKNRTGHAGLVGFVAFILLGALLLAPLLPGKVVDSFPLSSNTYSTGDSSLDCVGKQGRISSVTKYDHKAGTPITYTSATTTTQAATCDGQPQSAVVGHTSQLNPLGLVVDAIVALIAAIVIARIWRLIFGEKRHPSRHHED